MENRGDWETIGLTEMMNEVGKAGKAGKYAFIHDKQGNVPMFFQYKGVLCDFQREVMKVRINQGQPAEALWAQAALRAPPMGAQPRQK